MLLVCMMKYISNSELVFYIKKHRENNDDDDNDRYPFEQ